MQRTKIPLSLPTPNHYRTNSTTLPITTLTPINISHLKAFPRPASDVDTVLGPEAVPVPDPLDVVLLWVAPVPLEELPLALPMLVVVIALEPVTEDAEVALDDPKDAGLLLSVELLLPVELLVALEALLEEEVLEEAVPTTPPWTLAGDCELDVPFATAA